MLTNKYVSEVYENVKAKNEGQDEYLQAVYEVLSSLEPVVEKNPKIEKYADCKMKLQ